jgi:hypothetical protein
MPDMPQHVAMIGDDVSADLGEGAIEMGFYRYLGKYNQLNNWQASRSVNII